MVGDGECAAFEELMNALWSSILVSNRSFLALARAFYPLATGKTRVFIYPTDTLQNYIPTKLIIYIYMHTYI